MARPPLRRVRSEVQLPRVLTDPQLYALSLRDAMDLIARLRPDKRVMTGEYARDS